MRFRSSRFHRVLLIVLFALCCSRWGHAQTLAITPGLTQLYAGDPTGAKSPSLPNFVGPPSSLVVHYPRTLVFDTAGNLYIADTNALLIRVVAASSQPIPALPNVAVQAGNVYTIAFNGSQKTTPSCTTSTDSAGDGCPALDAWGIPGALAVDAKGNIYIADEFGELRVVYAGGSIPGLPSSPKPGYIYPIENAGDAQRGGGAGGPALTAGPIGSYNTVSVDAQGNIYQLGNGVLDVIYAAGTVPGISSPQVGYLYTIAGAGTGSGNGDGGPAIDATFGEPVQTHVDPSGNIYISDSFAGVNFGGNLRAIYVAGTLPGVSDPQVGDIYTVAGSGNSGSSPDGTLAINANFNQLADFTFDALGEIYIEDQIGIHKIDSSGVFTNVMGTVNGSGQFQLCAAPADQDVFGDGCPATQAALFGSQGLVVANDGSLYVSNTDFGIPAYVINKIDVATTTQTLTGTAGVSATAVATQSIRLSNLATASLQLSGISFSGPFQQAPTGGTTDCSASTALAAGESCEIGLVSTVTTKGTATGSLSIASNAANATNGTNTVALTVDVVPATSTTSFTVSPAYPSVLNAGQQATFTVTVAPQAGDSETPTGTVTILNGSTTVGTGTLSGGTATIQTSSLPAGADAVTAQYSGDPNFNPSTSYPTTVQVNAASSPAAAVTLSATPTTANAGTQVTLTATVSPFGGSTQPTGTVTFLVGPNAVAAPVPVNSSGTATLVTTTLPAGLDPLLATYSGDSHYTANTSAPVTVTIAPAAGQLSITPGVVNKLAGQYAGDSISGSSGDGGPANIAQLDVQSVGIDQAGNIYVIDNNPASSSVATIRVIASGNNTPAGLSNVTAGDIYTFAGGPSATGGDGVPATQSQLRSPNSLWVDTFNNVYFTDFPQNDNGVVVRRIDGKTGIVTTVAGNRANQPGYGGDGGPATSAQIAANGIFVDNAGNLFIADGQNDIVRRVDGLTGVITTIAGNTTNAGQLLGGGVPQNACTVAPCGDGGPALGAQFSFSGGAGIVGDSSGNLYIDDDGDQVIRRIDAKTGIITTVAGSYGTRNGSGSIGFAGGYGGDGGPATSAVLHDPIGLRIDAAGNLYFSDNLNNVIREVNAQTQIITTIAGMHGQACTAGPCGDGGLATSAQLSDSAQSVALDSANNVYFNDLGGVLREIPATGSALDFGNQNLGTTNSQVFTLTNSGGAPLALSGLAVNTTAPVPPPSPSDFSIQPSGKADCTATETLAPGVACQLGTQWFPTVTGAEAANFVISSNATNATAGSNTIALSGTALGSSGAQPQTITFPVLNPSYTYGTPVVLGATTTATGLPISYRVSGPASIAGSTLTPTGVGTVTVTAYQFGNVQYASAAPQSQTFQVTAAPLTFTAVSASVIVGQKVPTPTYTVTGFVNGDTQTIVTGTPVLTITNTQTGATVAPGSTAVFGSYSIVITGATVSAGPNYTVTFVNGTLSVTGSSPQTIVFGALPNVTYGVPAITLTAIAQDAQTGVNNGLQVAYTATGPAKVAGNLLTVTGAGAVAVTATQPGSANYAAATPVVQSFTVAQAQLTVTAGNQTAALNSALPVLTNDYSFSGFVSGDNTSSISGAPTLSTTAPNTSTLGQYPININQGSLTSTNYAFTFVNGTLSIVQGQSQTINFPAIANVTYGTAPIQLLAKASSNLGITYTVLQGPATAAGSQLAITGAGTVTVAANQAGSGGYSSAPPVTQTFTVNPAVLTVIANNATRVNNVPNPTFGFALTGFVNNDTQAGAVSGAPSLTTTATAGSPVGTYPITPGPGLTAQNYTFAFVPGTLTITTGGPTADFSLTLAPQQLSLLPGQAQQVTLTLAPTNYYEGLVSLKCSGAPANVSCVFSPASLAPDGTGSTITTQLVLNTNGNSTIVGALRPFSGTPAGFPGAALALAGGIGLMLIPRKRLLHRLHMQVLFLGMLGVGLLSLTACGGSSSLSGNNAGTGTSTITVTATGQDGVTHSLPLSLTVK